MGLTRVCYVSGLFEILLWFYSMLGGLQRAYEHFTSLKMFRGFGVLESTLNPRP